MPTQEQIRCCACARLLFCADPDALSGVVTIKCPRCRAMNILRPRALSPERAPRQTEKGPGPWPRPPRIPSAR
ncbi:Com family DNA-binding transcriptional regulator [Roseinatronobacter ekhonensis]|uniref:Com family DNA-binding transcriptional regulator n=1 Tax=Roseinatronobacter ekhonensis TaxID=254356 RepID=UPI000EB31D3E